MRLLTCIESWLACCLQLLDEIYGADLKNLPNSVNLKQCHDKPVFNAELYLNLSYLGGKGPRRVHKLEKNYLNGYLNASKITTGMGAI